MLSSNVRVDVLFVIPITAYSALPFPEALLLDRFLRAAFYVLAVFMETLPAHLFPT